MRRENCTYEKSYRLCDFLIYFFHPNYCSCFVQLIAMKVDLSILKK